MKISVIGVGYVGLATATVLAELGNDVIAADSDKGKIDNLNKGIMPIFEPELKEFLIAKRDAQEKLRDYYIDQMNFLEKGGTVTEFLTQQQGKAQQTQTDFSQMSDAELQAIVGGQ